MASVKVAVRVRPLSKKEEDHGTSVIIEMKDKTTSITNVRLPTTGAGSDTLGRERVKHFTYDYSYWSVNQTDPHFTSQEKVFEDLGTDVLSSAFQGYNNCVFAYGQTGSGKTYTMMGEEDNQGLIPRICEGLFAEMQDPDTTYRAQVSYLEIYNERVRDLLRDRNQAQSNLKVREHPKEGPYVQDLSKHLVVNYSDVSELISRGNHHRTTAATNMNEHSSRSHAIFTVLFTQAKFCEDVPSEIHSKIHLVDLAGSERADASGATGERLKEGGSINKSLVTLGNVISTLADWSDRPPGLRRNVFIPYRDSVLTWLLKDSLGGNARTIMIATISPAEYNYAESLSTLRYASRAKKIMNKPTINEDPHVKLIRELREENARLRALLGETALQDVLPSIQDFAETREKLNRNEERVRVLTEKWTDKWQETANVLEEHKTLALRREGTGIVLDSELPYILSIDDNVLSTGMRLYHIKEGDTHVGREDAGHTQDIALTGKMIEAEHCIIRHRDGVVTLVPLEGAMCSVNNVRIHEPTKLSQGSIIRLGRGHLFRYNHPAEAARLREEMKKGDSHQLIRVWQNFQWTWSSLSMADSALGSTSDKTKRKMGKDGRASGVSKPTKAIEKINEILQQEKKESEKEDRDLSATETVNKKQYDLDQKSCDEDLFFSNEDSRLRAAGDVRNNSCTHEEELKKLEQKRQELEKLTEQHVLAEAQRLAHIAEDEAIVSRSEQLAIEAAAAQQHAETLRQAQQQIVEISEDLEQKVLTHAEQELQLQLEQQRLQKLKDKLEKDKARARAERQKLRKQRELERAKLSMEKERQEIEWAELEKLRERLAAETQLQYKRSIQNQAQTAKIRSIEQEVYKYESSKMRALVESEMQELRAMAGLPPEGASSPGSASDTELNDLESLTLRVEPVGEEQGLPMRYLEGSEKPPPCRKSTGEELLSPHTPESPDSQTEDQEMDQLSDVITALHSSVLEALQRKYSSVLSSDDHTAGLATKVLRQFSVIRPRFYKLEKQSRGNTDLAVRLRDLDRLLHMVDKLVQVHEVLVTMHKGIKHRAFLKTIEQLDAVNNILSKLEVELEIEQSVKKVLQTEICIQREKLLYQLGETWNMLLKWSPGAVDLRGSSGRLKAGTVKLEISQGEGDHDLLSSVAQAMASVGMLDSRIRTLCDQLLASVIRGVVTDRSTLLQVVDEVDSYILRVSLNPASTARPILVPPAEAYQKLEQVFLFLHRPLHDIIVKEVVQGSSGKQSITLVEKIGQSICKKLFECIYNECLSHAIPKTGVQHWNQYNEIVLLTEKFEDTLRDLDYMDVNQDTLMDYLNNVNNLFASIKSQDLLKKAHEFMTQELMNSVQISAEHPLGNVRGPENEAREKYVQECKEKAATAKYKLPTCQISMPIRSLMCMAYDTMKEAQSGSHEGAAHILTSFQSMFELYCEVVPSYHREKLTNLPLLAALHHNNCMFVAHHLITVDRIFQLKLNPNRVFTPGRSPTPSSPSSLPPTSGRSPVLLRRSLTPKRLESHISRSLTPGPYLSPGGDSVSSQGARSKTPGPYLTATAEGPRQRPQGLSVPLAPSSPVLNPTSVPAFTLQRAPSRGQSPRSSQGLEGFSELIPRIKRLGNEGFSRHIGMKTGQLCDHLSSAEGFSCVADDEGRQATLAVENMMHHLRHISTIWRDVLPTVIYCRGIGSLLHTATNDIIKSVLSIEEFSVEDCEYLQEVLSIVVEQAIDLFRLDNDPKSNPQVTIHEYVPSWMKFKELGNLLGCSLQEVCDRWADGKGPLALHFTASEVAQLVVAIFENTSKRDMLLSQLRRRPSIHTPATTPTTPS